MPVPVASASCRWQLALAPGTGDWHWHQALATGTRTKHWHQAPSTGNWQLAQGTGTEHWQLPKGCTRLHQFLPKWQEGSLVVENRWRIALSGSKWSHFQFSVWAGAQSRRENEPRSDTHTLTFTHTHCGNESNSGHSRALINRLSSLIQVKL